MEKIIKSAVVLSSIFFISNCTSMNGKELIGNAVGNAANTQVGYNSHQCFTVKSRCVQGHYEEWMTSDGVPGCSCKEQ